MSHWNTNPKSKYHNQPITVDGIRYDGKMEYRRHCFLKVLEQAGIISDLRYHVLYELIPPIKKEVVCRKKDGTTYTRVTNEPRNYEADFVYVVNKTGEEVIEDFKGQETDLFKFKADLFFHLYGKHIRIVKQVNEGVY
jgi:hypothetical protein